MAKYKPADPLGIQRSLEPKGQLPQQAERLDTSLPIAEDEILIEVESLNIDSASFHQITEACEGNEERIKKHILDLVTKRGKHHNSITGSGGMLIGRVIEVGPGFPVDKKPVAVGDRIATLVSLTLTPLRIERIKKIHSQIDRVEIEGQAILFASGIFAKLPTDIPETVALAVLDVAGAPAQTLKIVKEGQVVVVIGGGGKSGLLCLYQAKKIEGVRTIAVEYSQKAIDRMAPLAFIDEIVQADARNAIEVMDKIWAVTKGKMADVVINVANIPDTEMSSILSCHPQGLVYF
ncbi:MAG: L-erythro-3,5-diaminohexanoate dehydrogenase, partial [Bdellovibrionota bacterium]